MSRLSLPADLASLDQLFRYVDDLSAAGRLDGIEAYHLRLATEEVATNIITHAPEPADPAAPASDRCYWVEGGTDGNRVWLSLSDAAPPFDPTQVPDPETLDRPLEERPVGGLGIYLVRQVLDEFTYERAGGLNRITLAVRRRGTTERENP